MSNTRNHTQDVVVELVTQFFASARKVKCDKIQGVALTQFYNGLPLAVKQWVQNGAISQFQDLRSHESKDKEPETRRENNTSPPVPRTPQDFSNTTTTTATIAPNSTSTVTLVDDNDDESQPSANDAGEQQLITTTTTTTTLAAEESPQTTTYVARNKRRRNSTSDSQSGSSSSKKSRTTSSSSHGSVYEKIHERAQDLLRQIQNVDNATFTVIAEIAAPWKALQSIQAHGLNDVLSQQSQREQYTHKMKQLIQRNQEAAKYTPIIDLWAQINSIAPLIEYVERVYRHPDNKLSWSAIHKKLTESNLFNFSATSFKQKRLIYAIVKDFPMLACSATYGDLQKHSGLIRKEIKDHKTEDFFRQEPFQQMRINVKFDHAASESYRQVDDVEERVQTLSSSEAQEARTRTTSADSDGMLDLETSGDAMETCTPDGGSSPLDLQLLEGAGTAGVQFPTFYGGDPDTSATQSMGDFDVSQTLDTSGAQPYISPILSNKHTSRVAEGAGQVGRPRNNPLPPNVSIGPGRHARNWLEPAPANKRVKK